MMGRTVTIKVRFADFTTITRSRTLRDPTDVSRDIYATARSCSTRWASSEPGSGSSGCGWRASSKGRAHAIQATLDEPEHGWRDADRAVDRASARFGAGAVRPAALVRDHGEAPRSAAAAAGAARADASRNVRDRQRPPDDARRPAPSRPVREQGERAPNAARRTTPRTRS